MSTGDLIRSEPTNCREKPPCRPSMLPPSTSKPFPGTSTRSSVSLPLKKKKKKGVNHQKTKKKNILDGAGRRHTLRVHGKVAVLEDNLQVELVQKLTPLVHGFDQEQVYGRVKLHNFVAAI